jgi:hypothetical protein
MKRTKDLIKIYTGPEGSAILLKAQLEEINVYTLTKNDFSGAYMGFVRPSVDLWIYEDDFPKAKTLIEEFNASKESDIN